MFDFNFIVAYYFCSETRFIEVVEHACDESSKEVYMPVCLISTLTMHDLNSEVLKNF